MAEPRDTSDYRGRIRARDLSPCRVRVKESDLLILTPTPRAKEATHALLKVRLALEAYIDLHPEFATSLVPLEAKEGAPEIVVRMARAARIAGVGPMAAVAGAIAQAVGEELGRWEEEVVVENGGDIYLKSSRPRTVALYAGDSPLSMKVGIRVKGERGIGICTSSGRIGHSLSLGRAHSVTVVAPQAALADAAATALANMVKEDSHISRALELAGRMEGILGTVVIFEDKLGARGNIELVPLEAE